MAAIGSIGQDEILSTRQHFPTPSLRKPKLLFITCTDCPITPEVLTRSEPDELMVPCSPGNVVPVYNPFAPEDISTTLECAVSTVGVRRIVVCGHSECGVMDILLHPQRIAAVDTLDPWLDYAKPALRKVSQNRDLLAETGAVLLRLTELNVLLQIEHLKTHPSVARAITRRRMTLEGWLCDVDSCRVFVYDVLADKFLLSSM